MTDYCAVTANDDPNDMKHESIAQDAAGSSTLKARYPLHGWPGIAITAVWIIIGVGGVLRLASILTNRSMWMDETLLAQNVVSCRWSDLLWGHLEGSQVAPQGFMLLEKLAVRMLGGADWVLRLVPLLAGMVLLPLFFLVARRFLSVSGTLAGLLLVALSCRLAYYAAEIKPYSSDATMSLAILWGALFWLRAPDSRWRTALLAIGGAVAIWFSYPMIFILGGVGAVMLRGRRPDGRRCILAACLCAACWITSFGVQYWLAGRYYVHNEDLQWFWGPGFAPLPTSLTAVTWYLNTFTEIFHDPGGYTLAGVGALLFIAGYIHLQRDHRQVLVLLGAPLLLALAASALHRYPFEGRVLLWAVPLLVLPMAAGIQSFLRALWPRNRALAVGMTVFVLIYPLKDGALWLKRFPHQSLDWPPREEIRSVLEYLRAHRRPGDAVYAFGYDMGAVDYYSPRLGLTDIDVQDFFPRTTTYQDMAPELATIKGKRRAWVILAHVYPGLGRISQRASYLILLDSMGRRLDEFTPEGAGIYLYDFTEVNAPSASRPAVSTSPIGH